MNSFMIVTAANALQIILSAVPSAFWKEPMAEFLDAVRNRIEASESKVDDIALPLIKRLRDEFDLPAYD